MSLSIVPESSDTPIAIYRWDEQLGREELELAYLQVTLFEVTS